MRKLDLPSLRFRRLRGDIIEEYKLTHGLYDGEVQPHLQPVQQISRSHQFKLYKGPTPRTELRRNYFTGRIIEVWYRLPENVVSANSINSFKNQLHNYWKNHHFQYDHDI